MSNFRCGQDYQWRSSLRQYDPISTTGKRRSKKQKELSHALQRARVRGVAADAASRAREIASNRPRTAPSTLNDEEAVLTPRRIVTDPARLQGDDSTDTLELSINSLLDISHRGQEEVADHLSQSVFGLSIRDLSASVRGLEQSSDVKQLLNTSVYSADSEGLSASIRAILDGESGNDSVGNGESARRVALDTADANLPMDPNAEVIIAALERQRADDSDLYDDAHQSPVTASTSSEHAQESDKLMQTIAPKRKEYVKETFSREQIALGELDLAHIRRAAKLINNDQRQDSMVGSVQERNALRAQLLDVYGYDIGSIGNVAPETGD